MSDDDHYLRRELYDLVRTDPAIFDFLQEGSLDGLWYRDLDRPGQEWISPRFWQVLGYDPDAMPHDPASRQEVIHRDDLQAALEDFRRHCADASHACDRILRYRHRAGHTVTIRCRGIAIRDGSGRAIRMLGVHNDVGTLIDAKAAERARGQVAAATLAKTVFVGNVSHDIRTPLNSILMNADALRATDLTPAQAELLDDMLLAGDQLQELLADLIDISRTESGEGAEDAVPDGRCDGKEEGPKVEDAPPPAGLPPGLRVIVAEDVLLNRRSLTHLLAPFAMELVFATNGVQALKLMKSIPFDVALIDLRMPGMSGTDAVVAYRAFEAAARRARRPIIACSAHVLDEEKAEYRAKGFDDFVSKPLKRDDLVEVIARVR